MDSTASVIEKKLEGCYNKCNIQEVQIMNRNNYATRIQYVTVS